MTLLNAWTTLLLGGAVGSFAVALFLLYLNHGDRALLPRTWDVLRPISKFNAWVLGVMTLYFAVRGPARGPAPAIASGAEAGLISLLLILFVGILSALLLPAVLLCVEAHPRIWKRYGGIRALLREERRR